MRSRYRINEHNHAHFVTATIVSWLPIFTTAARCNIIVDSWQYCRTHKDLKVYAWVILDNHLHAILAAPDLSQVLKDFKRHTAQRLMEQLSTDGGAWLLDRFGHLCSGHKSESEHQIWQEGSHPQALLIDAIAKQKMEYLHNNPVKRGLVAAPEHWRYSSAYEWMKGCEPVLRVIRGNESLRLDWPARGHPLRAKYNFAPRRVTKLHLVTRGAERR